MTELIQAAGRSPAEWREYVRQAERGCIEGTLEWCRRVYEAKQHYGGSFRAWAGEWYQEYKYSTLCRLAKIGALADKLFRITKQVPVANDWTALYELTTIPEAEWPALERIDQKTLKAYKRDQKHPINAPPLPSGKYSVILADPPWQYDFSETSQREVENHYPTLGVDDICGLTVEDLAAPDSVLFLWATAPKLREALSVIDAWGFDYKTHAIWDKQWVGMGYYFRGRHELLLVATRGQPGVPEPNVRPDSVISVKRSSRHSEKPGIVYTLIEDMYPKAARIELFSRVVRDGWDAWGNESAAV